MVSFFDLFAMLVLLTAAFGWLNLIFFHLPSNIGLLLMGLAASLIVLAFGMLGFIAKQIIQWLLGM